MTVWARCHADHPAPAMRLICFPYAGAGASVYSTWRIPGDFPAQVWSVQLPARENRRADPHPGHLAPLVSSIVTELDHLWDRPFAFFGHSMGALMAFEVARCLRRSGRPLPIRMFLSGFRAPHLPRRRPAISDLPDEEYVERLQEMADGSPDALRDPELWLFLAPMARADFRMCERYRYVHDEPLSMPLSCFSAVDDPEVRVDEVAQWWRHTTSYCLLRTFTGGHLYVRDRRQELLEHIAAELAGHAV